MATPDSNGTVSKEVTAQVVKWGFWAVMVLMGTGLVSVANRNVYSKTEVDERDEQVKRELRHYQELQLLQHDQVVYKIDELKASVDAIQKELKTK